MENEEMQINYKQKLLITLITIVIIFFALFIKFKDYQEFIQNEVVIATHDAFRFARWAEEIKNGTYGSIDYLINVPDFGVNPNPPPLPSLIAAWLSNLFNIELKTLFVVLPPLFSVLFIIPMYFWLRTFVNQSAIYFIFIGGAMLGIFNINYFVRTRMGYFDNDCLLLFFIFLILALFAFALREKENLYKSYFYILLSGLVFKLFMWWYYLPVMALFFIFSLVSGLLLNRFSVKDIFLKILIFIFIILTPQLVSDLFSFIYGYIFGAVLRLTDPIVSDIYSNIQELQPVSFERFVSFTTDNLITFVIAYIGLFLFIIKFYRHAILIIPFVILGILSFKLGNRYTIYIAPFLGIGLAYMVYQTVNYLSLRYKKYVKALIAGGFIFTIFISFPGQILHSENSLAFTKCNLKGLKELENLTERDSYILTWWDFGNPIEYLARRATFINNTQAYPEKLYFYTQALMTSDENKARSLISFITNNTANSYLDEIKKKGISQVLLEASEYKIETKVPVYLYFNQLMLSMHIIHGIGLNNKDIKKGKNKVFGDFFRCNPIENAEKIYDCVYTAFHDGKKDTLIRNNVDSKRAYREIFYVDKQAGTNSLISFNENAPNNTALYIIKASDGELYSIPVTEMAKRSIYNRMYILRDKFKNFELVYDDFPHTVVYKLK